MRVMIIAAILALAGCSKPPEADNTATVGYVRSDNGALMQTQPVAATQAAAERMEVFALLKAPVTPGNSYDLRVCAILFDKDGQPVAADGQFSVRSALVEGGAYVNAPKYGPLLSPGHSSPLGVCPISAPLGSEEYRSNRGKLFPIEVSFMGASGKILSASTAFSY